MMQVPIKEAKKRYKANPDEESKKALDAMLTEVDLTNDRYVQQLIEKVEQQSGL